MPRVMPKADVVRLAVEYFQDFRYQRNTALDLDEWDTPRKDAPQLYRPSNAIANDEYEDIASRASTPWLSLVITACVQTCFLDGMRRPGENENLRSWDSWQRNGMDSRQMPLYRGALRHGVSYVTVLPGEDPLTREPLERIRGYSATSMAAFFEDVVNDDWPMFAIQGEPYGHDGREEPTYTQPGDRNAVVNLDRIAKTGLAEYGWYVRIYDESAVHFLSCKGDGGATNDWTYISYELHGSNVTPVVPYSNLTDLSGRRVGEIEPLIPLAKRIDQDTFDRLIVQRFGAWKVRYIAGMTQPASKGEAYEQKLRLRVEDLLIAADPDTKFGTLDASDLAGFIAARDADLRDLSAVSQTPPHHMLGLSSNLQAESLAAAEAGLGRKSQERKIGWGESHERTARLTAMIRGDVEEARAYDLQARWRDMESRSMSQAADALGKLATQVGVPQEMLFERIPGWTDSDVIRAKQLVADGQVDALLEVLQGTDLTGVTAGTPTKAVGAA